MKFEKKQFENALAIYFNTHRRKFKPFNPPYLEYTLVSLTSATGVFGSKPVISKGSKWKWLAVSYSKNEGVLVREKPYAQGLLRPIVNKSYLGAINLAIIYGYRYQPLTDDPDDFVSLGCFHEYSDGYPVNIQDLVGVHQSLCVRGKTGKAFTYYFNGTPINSYSWYISPQEDTLDLSTITCSDNPNPRYESIWILRKDFMEYVDFAKLKD